MQKLVSEFLRKRREISPNTLQSDIVSVRVETLFRSRSDRPLSLLDALFPNRWGHCETKTLTFQIPRSCLCSNSIYFKKLFRDSGAHQLSSVDLPCVDHNYRYHVFPILERYLKQGVLDWQPENKIFVCEMAFHLEIPMILHIARAELKQTATRQLLIHMKQAIFEVELMEFFEAIVQVLSERLLRRISSSVACSASASTPNEDDETDIKIVAREIPHNLFRMIICSPNFDPFSIYPRRVEMVRLVRLYVQLRRPHDQYMPDRELELEALARELDTLYSTLLRLRKTRPKDAQCMQKRFYRELSRVRTVSEFRFDYDCYGGEKCDSNDLLGLPGNFKSFKNLPKLGVVQKSGNFVVRKSNAALTNSSPLLSSKPAKTRILE